MIIDPITGERRLPTREEILQRVRERQQSRQDTTGATSPGVNSGRPGETLNRTYGQYDIAGRRETSDNGARQSNAEGRSATIQSREGSAYGNDDNIYGTNRQTRERGDSSDEHSERDTVSTAASDRYYEYTQQPVKQGPISFIKGAIKSTFTPKSQERKQQRKKKETRKPYTKTEAAAKREDVITILMLESDQADQVIIATTKGHDHSIRIWSSMDRDDCEVVADWMLKRAMKSGQAAAQVDFLLEIREKIQLGLITIPRGYQTIREYFTRGISIW